MSRSVMRFAVWSSAALLACSRAPVAAVAPQPSPQVAPEPARRVVLISIDGLKPEYLAEADARGLKIPALRSLMASGSRAKGMESVWPTVTYPAHTTLVTGVSPARHGILANGPFDPFVKNWDGWYWYAEAIRSKTLWTAAHERSLTVGNVYWPVTVGAAIDWSFPQVWRAKNDEDDKLMRALATPGLSREVEAAFGVLPAEHRTDKERANAVELILKTHRPALMLVYFTDLDTEQHKSGPFSTGAIATLEDIDADVMRVIEATKSSGTFARTAFVVVSDHGFAAIHTAVRPGVMLREAGLIDVDDAGRVRDYRAAAWKSGGLCAIMLKNPTDVAAAAQVTTLFTQLAGIPQNGIAKVHPGKLIAARGGFPGATIVLEAANGFVFGAGVSGPATAPSGDKGAHGFPPDRPDMRASFLISGDGVRAAAELGVVKMVDVAPTVAKLLSVSLPEAEGHAIDLALTF